MNDISNKLNILSKKIKLSEQIEEVFHILRDISSDISRIGIALYSPDTDTLHTYYKAEEGHDSSAMKFYQLRLSESSSLSLLSQDSYPRIVDSIADTYADNYHSNSIKQAGFKSSFTLPMYFDGHFHGFIFINGNKEGVFSRALQQQILFVSHLISQLIHTHIREDYTFRAAVKTILNMGHVRDPETQGHLTRMSLYCEIIAKTLAKKHQLPAYFSQQMKMYAPLHDIGKYRIPDNILFSTKRFTDQERQVMNKHPEYGVGIVEEMQKHFGFEESDDIFILKNIILYHHERIDGKGYPYQITANDIPLEARIVAVADVFDALMSVRPYKKAWSLHEVLAYIEENTGTMFNSECVESLKENIDSIIEIHQKYHD